MTQPERRKRGRPPGAASKKTREIANKAAQSGITPLEVMLEAMRDSYAKWKGGLSGDLKPEEQALMAQAAIMAADKCAPYIHPRLSAVEAKVEGDMRQRIISDKPLTEEEWAATYSTIQ